MYIYMPILIILGDGNNTSINRELMDDIRISNQWWGDHNPYTQCFDHGIYRESRG